MILVNFTNSKSNRILIIHTDGNTFNNPSLKCIIDLLLENGFKIDLRYPESHAPMPLIDNIRLIPFGKFTKRLKHIIFNRLCSKLLMNMTVFLEKIIYYKKYDLIIGVDRQGLLEANILNKLTKTPYTFISFEIAFEKETSIRYKDIEKKASKNVSGWIVQDEERAQKLVEENTLQDSNKFLLPLASAGIGKSGNIRLRDHLGIPKTKNVAIAIGSVSSWSMTSEVIRSITNWPDDWVLIIHERYGRTHEVLAEELLSVEDLINKKIFISDSATDLVDDMSMILSGVDIGLAFYEPDYSGPHTGDNLKYLGLASGKISTYLRYGIPVIVNETGLYAEEIRKYRLGAVVSKPEEITNMLVKVKNNIHEKNMKEYFSQYLDFNIYADEVLAEFLSVINNK